jgi:hypothetical protein
MAGDHTPEEHLMLLQRGILARQDELRQVASFLAKKARRYTFISRTLKTVLIVLGAMLAAQGAASNVFTGYHVPIGATSMIFGVVISCVAGIEAAFKYDSRSAELNVLATFCHSIVRLTDASWQKNVAIQTDWPSKRRGALALIETQNAKLTEIQARAASLEVVLPRFQDSRYGNGAKLPPP